MAVEVRRPTGNGATANWSGSGGGAAWEGVDEVSADDDTTYAFRADSFANHRFTFTAFAINSSAIASVTVRSRARVTLGGNGSDFTTALTVTGDELVFGALQADIGTSYADFVDTWATNPKTGAAWTEADVEGTGSNPLTQFGMRASTMVTFEEMRCTQISIEVDYTPAGGGGATHPGWVSSRGGWYAIALAFFKTLVAHGSRLARSLPRSGQRSRELLPQRKWRLQACAGVKACG